MKTKYESLQSTVVGFLEYMTKPFDGSTAWSGDDALESNLQPDLTSAGLRCWWDVKVGRRKKE